MKGILFTPAMVRAILDRINNDEGYTPQNCRFASKKVQMNNTRKTIRITYGGVTRPLTEWAEIIGISAKTLSCRLYRGWSAEKALSTPVLAYGKERRHGRALSGVELREKVEGLTNEVQQL